MLAMGIDPKPSNDEEKEYVQQRIQQMAQQQQQPDAMMLAAQAEMVKAQADMLEQQNNQAAISIKAAEMQQKGYKIALDEKMQQSEIANVNADTVKKISEAEKTSGETFSNQLADLKSIMPN